MLFQNTAATLKLYGFPSCCCGAARGMQDFLAEIDCGCQATRPHSSCGPWRKCWPLQRKSERHSAAGYSGVFPAKPQPGRYHDTCAHPKMTKTSLLLSLLFNVFLRCLLSLRSIKLIAPASVQGKPFSPAAIVVLKVTRLA